MAGDERVWLKHNETGGINEFPVDAVDGWKELGWEPTDERPKFVNPVTATMPAEWFEPIPPPKQVDEDKPSKTKSASKSKPDAGTSTKGSD
jgi:hypothetical protein